MIKATNNFVLLTRDKTENEKNGLIIPSGGKVKPHVGTIVSVGGNVKDADIKRSKGKKCLFHPTVGFTIEFDGTEYLVLLGDEIISLV